VAVPAQIAVFLLLTFLFDTKRKVSHALRCSTASLSAIMAMNSPFVGLSSGVQTRHPKAEFSVSIRPRFHATSMACRMARSTLEALKAALRASLEYSARPLCRYNAKHFIAVSQ